MKKDKYSMVIIKELIENRMNNVNLNLEDKVSIFYSRPGSLPLDLNFHDPNVLFA